MVLKCCGPYGMGLWKHIRKGWDTFLSHTCIEVGDDTFPMAEYMEEVPLKVAFFWFCLDNIHRQDSYYRQFEEMSSSGVA